MGISFRHKPLVIPLSRRVPGKRMRADRLPDNLYQYVLDLLVSAPAPKRDLDRHIKSVRYAAGMMEDMIENGFVVIRGSGKPGDRKMYRLTQAGYNEAMEGRKREGFD